MKRLYFLVVIVAFIGLFESTHASIFCDQNVTAVRECLTNFVNCAYNSTIDQTCACYGTYGNCIYAPSCYSEDEFCRFIQHCPCGDQCPKSKVKCINGPPSGAGGFAGLLGMSLLAVAVLGAILV
eukprot:Phypoly_transcript_30078.p1 GENE.Phypoly_transcript_30078~~Phypoly_transcript_30078.p1  ORF type:complete len:125 (+),score=11.14 Phypoly_transcript_30078:48-422(+)